MLYYLERIVAMLVWNVNLSVTFHKCSCNIRKLKIKKKQADIDETS